MHVVVVVGDFSPYVCSTQKLVQDRCSRDKISKLILSYSKQSTDLHNI